MCLYLWYTLTYLRCRNFSVLWVMPLQSICFTSVAAAAVFIHVDGMKLSLWTAATRGSFVHPQGDIWVWRAMVEWYWQGVTQELWRQTCPNATFSATYPTWTDPGVNPGPCSETQVTNRLIHGTAFASVTTYVVNILKSTFLLTLNSCKILIKHNHVFKFTIWDSRTV
jgi:hypothetical protein